MTIRRDIKNIQYGTLGMYEVLYNGGEGSRVNIATQPIHAQRMLPQPFQLRVTVRRRRIEIKKGSLVIRSTTFLIPRIPSKKLPYSRRSIYVVCPVIVTFPCIYVFLPLSHRCKFPCLFIKHPLIVFQRQADYFRTGLYAIYGSIMYLRTMLQHVSWHTQQKPRIRTTGSNFTCNM